MTTAIERPPVSPGEPAPDFTLAVVGSDRTVSLADYRGRSPVLLALFRGLYCPFCRRAIAQLGVTCQQLKGLGVETLAVVATNQDNANVYFRFRPTRAPLAVDPELSTHGAYRLPHPAVTPEFMHAIEQARVNPTGDLPAPLNPMQAMTALDKLEGYTRTASDHQDLERQFPQLKGQFLIDRDGIVRWANIEGATEGMNGIGKFPTDAQLLEAARALER